jgi:hypothetical protein
MPHDAALKTGGFVRLAAPEGAPIRLAAGEPSGQRRFEMEAYSGAPVELFWGAPVIFDTDGIQIGSGPTPILLQHGYVGDSILEAVFGHSDDVRIAEGRVTIRGVVSGVSEQVKLALDLAAAGFPFQASLGLWTSKVEFVDAKTEVTVNGRRMAGPLYVVRACVMRESSIVVMGADYETQTKIAASFGAGKARDMSTVQNTAAASAATEQDAAKQPAIDFQQIAAEAGRVAAESAAKAAKDSYLRLARVEQLSAGHPDIRAKAIAEDWSLDKVELEVHRAGRGPAGSPAVILRGGDVGNDVVEAAICLAGKLPGTEKAFKEQTLDAANRAFRRGIGLQEVLMHFAAQAGYRGGSVRHDLPGVIRAAFSTREISGILANVANKALAVGFGMAEQAWRSIAKIRPVNDFKSVTVYRLTGDYTFKRLGPSGELESGTLANESYTIKADTSGRLVSIDRRDIINDDLGALTEVPMRLARGAGVHLNEIFWAAFGNNASFFTAPRGNLLTGAGSVLGVAGLKAAEAAFMQMTDDQGKPLGLRGSILLAPPQLSFDARQLYTSQEVRDTTASKIAPTANVFVGLYQPVTSAYVGLTAFGGSATNWYLLADPNAMPVAEIAFLNGQETPTIETVEPDADSLGVTMRGYLDFGAALAEYRGGIRNAGA